MALKASRTIFCTEFDTSLLRTYDKDAIKEMLENTGWKVAEVHIMKRKTTFKIEMQTKNEATKFLANTRVLFRLRLKMATGEPLHSKKILKWLQNGEKQCKSRKN